MRQLRECLIHSLQVSQHGFPPNEILACFLNTSLLTGKDELELKSCEWAGHASVRCMPVFLLGFLWFKALQFKQDGKHERAVFDFT